MATSGPTPGWYPDPDGTGEGRYWDGERWTNERRSIAAAGTSTASPSGFPPVSSPRGWSALSPGVQLRVVLAAVVAVVGLILGILHGKSSSGGWAPSPASAPSSTSKDWVASVCRPGPLVNGGGQTPPGSNLTGSALPGATGQTACVSPTGHLILIGQFATSAAMEAAIASYGGAYATTTDGSGTIWVFLSLGSGPTNVGTNYTDVLSPLKRFGFQLQPNR
jgi:hypothetical protein